MYGQGVISTDRPTNTYSTSVVNKGVVVVETGVLLERTDIGNDDRSVYNDFGQTFVRIGTGANLEIQVATSFASSKPAPNTDATNGLTPLKLGGKVHIADEKGAWPEISFIGNVTLPWIGEESFRPEYVAPDFRFIFYNSLAQFCLRLSLCNKSCNPFIASCLIIFSLPVNLICKGRHSLSRPGECEIKANILLISKYSPRNCIS